ncbi:hypothetical protein GW17_00060055 [Ensete ventricosum]|nr:hypothetical protein GW17_00060055 [Ensete ventricosum]
MRPRHLRQQLQLPFFNRHLVIGVDHRTRPPHRNWQGFLFMARHLSRWLTRSGWRRIMHRSSPNSRALPTPCLLLDLAAIAAVFSDLPKPPLPPPSNSRFRICAESGSIPGSGPIHSLSSASASIFYCRVSNYTPPTGHPCCTLESCARSCGPAQAIATSPGRCIR